MKRKVQQVKNKTFKLTNALDKSTKVARKPSQKQPKKTKSKNNKEIFMYQQCCTSRLFQQIDKIKAKLAIITNCQILQKKPQHSLAKKFRPQSQRSKLLKDSINCQYCKPSQYSTVKGKVKQRSCNSALQFSSEKKPNAMHKQRQKYEHSRKFKSFNLGLYKYQQENNLGERLNTETDKNFKGSENKWIVPFNPNQSLHWKFSNKQCSYDKSSADSQSSDQYQLRQTDKLQRSYKCNYRFSRDGQIAQARAQCQIKCKKKSLKNKCQSMNNYEQSAQKCQYSMPIQQKMKYRQQLKRLQQMNRKLLDDKKQLQSQLSYQSQQKKLIFKKFKYSEANQKLNADLGKQKQTKEVKRKQGKEMDNKENIQIKRYQKYLKSQTGIYSRNAPFQQDLQQQSKLMEQLASIQYQTKKKSIIQAKNNENTQIQTPINNQPKICINQEKRNQKIVNSIIDKSLITNDPNLDIKFPYVIAKENTRQKKHKFINLYENNNNASTKKAKNSRKQSRSLVSNAFQIYQNQASCSKITQKKYQYRDQNALLLPQDFPLDSQANTLRQSNDNRPRSRKHQANIQNNPVSSANLCKIDKQNQSSIVQKQPHRANKQMHIIYQSPSSISQIANKNICQQKNIENQRKFQCLLRSDSFNQQQSAKTQSILLDQSQDRQLSDSQSNSIHQQQNKFQDNKKRLHKLQKYFNELISFNRLQKQMSKKMQIRRELAEIAKQIHHLKNNIIV